jgi:hypothetical protein
MRLPAFSLYSSLQGAHLRDVHAWAQRAFTDAGIVSRLPACCAQSVPKLVFLCVSHYTLAWDKSGYVDRAMILFATATAKAALRSGTTVVEGASSAHHFR